ncbi:MAG: hypothetical protein M3N45_08015 [Actinomycetota bacterium]|nr:hypothetical protein [Actinomycetota bacterium]
MAVVVVLVLAIVSLFVAGREVQAKEQPTEQAPQQQHSKVVITDRGASESDDAEAARDDVAEVPRSETPREEEPSPPPVGSVPSDPEPAPVPDPVVPDPPMPAPVPAPQPQFAVIIVNGQVVWFDAEAPWYWPVRDTDHPAEPVPWPEPGDDWPTTPQPIPSDQYEPQTPVWEPEPVAPPSEDISGSASDPAPWPVYDGAETPLLTPVSSDLAPPAIPDPAPSASWPALSPEPPIASWGNGPLPAASYAEPAVERPVTLTPPVAVTGLGSSTTAKNNLPANVAPLLPSPVHKPYATPTQPKPAMSSFPVGLGRAASTAVNAVQTVRSAAALAAASVAAEVSGALAGGSVGSSPDAAAQDRTQGAPQQEPAPPLAPPMGGSSFSLSGGSGGQAGPGGGAVPLLVGILASVLVLRRYDCWKYLASCDLPKPSSALLLPLERPG